MVRAEPGFPEAQADPGDETLESETVLDKVGSRCLSTAGNLLHCQSHHCLPLGVIQLWHLYSYIIYVITGLKFGFICFLLALFGKKTTEPWSDHHFVF